jgi:hypothetical protein
MALTRRFLKGMGLTEEQVDTIIEAHTEVTDGLKEQINQYKADADKLVGVQKELDDLKLVGDGGYKSKYESEKKAHDELKANIAKEKAYASKESAYRELLKAAGVKDKFIDTIIRAEKSTIEGLNIEDGKVEGSDTLTEAAKKNWGDFIGTQQVVNTRVENPPANTGGTKLTKAEIYARDEHGRYKLSTAERQKALAENPELMN